MLKLTPHSHRLDPCHNKKRVKRFGIYIEIWMRFLRATLGAVIIPPNTEEGVRREAPRPDDGDYNSACGVPVVSNMKKSVGELTSLLALKFPFLFTSSDVRKPIPDQPGRREVDRTWFILERDIIHPQLTNLYLLLHVCIGLKTAPSNLKVRGWMNTKEGDFDVKVIHSS